MARLTMSNKDFVCADSVSSFLLFYVKKRAQLGAARKNFGDKMHGHFLRLISDQCLRR